MIELIAQAPAVTIDAAVRTAAVNIHAVVSVLVMHQTFCFNKMHMSLPENKNSQIDQYQVKRIENIECILYYLALLPVPALIEKAYQNKADDPERKIIEILFRPERCAKACLRPAFRKYEGQIKQDHGNKEFYKIVFPQIVQRNNYQLSRYKPLCLQKERQNECCKDP